MRSRWIVAVVMTLIGLTFIGQGLGILGGRSLMVGDTRWAVVGVGLVAVGVVVAWTAIRGRRRA